MKNLLLSVKERATLMTLLPATGGRMEMIVIESFANKIKFNPQDITTMELRDTADGGIVGNPAKFTDMVYEINESDTKILKDISAKLDKDKKVTRQILPLLDKIDAL